MALDLEKMREWMNSPEGQASLQAFADKIAFESARVTRAHNIIQERGETFIDKLIEREVAKYTEEYRDKCYNMGYEPYPTNITGLLFDVAGRYCESQYEDVLDEFDAHFGGGTVNYMGYQFNWINGQGTVLRIFKDGQEILHI